MNNIADRIWKCVKKSLPKAGRMCLWLLKIILPISLLVRLLQYSGLLGEFSDLLSPVFSLIGLPGETAIIFLTSIFTPLYAPIALISSMSLGLREGYDIGAHVPAFSQSYCGIFCSIKDRLFILGNDLLSTHNEFCCCICP